MDRLSIAEMILDWVAMGYQFKTDAKQWWIKKNEYYQKNMTKTTFNTVDKVIRELFPE